jgi:hypothetical protein
MADKIAEFKAALSSLGIGVAATPNAQTNVTGTGKVPDILGTPDEIDTKVKPEIPLPTDNNMPTPLPRTPPSVPGVHPQQAQLAQNATDIASESIAGLPNADVNLPLDFFDTFYGRLRRNTVPYTGLNEDFTRKTGVNDVSHKNTLRYQRLADEINARRHIGAAKLGTANLVRGNLVTTGASQIGPGDIYKMDGLETEETRAQKRAGEYEAEERKREIKRAQDVKDMPAALERLKELAVLDQAGKLTEAELKERQDLFSAMLNNEYNIPYMMFNLEYATLVGMTPQQYAADIALQMAKFAADNGLTFQQYATQLGMNQARYNTMLNAVTQQYATTLAEYLQKVIGIEIPINKRDLIYDKNGTISNPTSFLRAAALGDLFGVAVADPTVQAQMAYLGSLGLNFANTQDWDSILRAIGTLQTNIAKVGQETAKSTEKVVR